MMSVQRVGRRLALGALTLALVASAADHGLARVRADNGPVAPSQSPNRQRSGQATPAQPDSQRPGNQTRLPWWQDPAVVKEIRLTPDQTRKIDTIWKKRELEVAGTVAEHKKQQDELMRLLAERKVGPDVIGLQVDRVEAQRTTLNKSRTVMIYQLSLILTPDQNTALKAYFEKNRRERR